MAQRNRHAKRAKKVKKRRDAKKRRALRKLVTNQESVQGLWNWFLPDVSIFASLPRHGNAKWQWSSLIFLAIAWCWVDFQTLTEAFAEASILCRTMFHQTPFQSYQGFMDALVSATPKALPLLQQLLQQRMEELGGEFWEIDGYVPIAFDGSRSTAPRTQSNEEAFCAKNYGKSATAAYRRKKRAAQGRPRREKPAQPQEPQVWITMLWHMGFRLAWSWRLGPSDSSERAHVSEMLQQRFPENTMFCGDAGFVGYPLWSEICLEKKRDFLVRVGGNVNLLAEHARFQLPHQLGDDCLVWCWPQEAQRKNQLPLRLRLIKVQVGKTAAWLLTNVLDPQKLTAATALRLYKMRWGIEVDFRGLKQTLQRSKLRCRNSERVLAELNWSILAKAVAELWALKEQQTRRATKKRLRSAAAAEHPAYDPGKRSLAQIMRVLRSTLRSLDATPEMGQDLSSRLQRAVTDNYQRKKPKAARYRPKNPDKKPLGDPILRALNKKERRKLEKLNQNQSI